MSLEMRSVCERCGKNLQVSSTAFICTFECTFCDDCSSEMEHVCPNCAGELVRRPREKVSGNG